MGYTAENVRKFFHPAAIDAMLETFVPLINGTSLDVRVPHIPFPPWPEYDRHVVEHPILPVLSVDIPTVVTPAVLPSHAIPIVGVDQLLHV
jgi:hypothetical protein